MSHPSPTTWRLIPLIQTSGAEQMAIDTWMFDRYQRGELPPTLRFYLWSPAAISLGRLQQHWPAHWASIQVQGQPLDHIRRPTGGRAVLHQGDLCYAWVSAPGSGSRWQLYRQICDLLIQAWGRLGVDLHYGSAGRGYIHNPSCFNTATGADLVTATGQKLIGSAQRRGKAALLQQGSMLLSPDKHLYEQIFSQPAPWDQPLYSPQQAELQIPQIIETIVERFEDTWGVTLIPQPLSPLEWQQIQTEITMDNLRSTHST